MKGGFRVWLKAGERIFVNGAVLRADRKCSLEFLNDVTFLLEAHVMQPDATTTPLRQLYFFAQSMLIDPANAATAEHYFSEHCAALQSTLTDPRILAGLAPLPDMIADGRAFEALKAIRALFPIEAEIIAGRSAEKHVNAAE